MFTALRRPALTRALATGLLTLAVVGVPGATVDAAAAEPRPPYRVVAGLVLHPKPPAFRLPVAGYQLTGRFGDRSALWSSSVHTGLDFAAPSGTPIRSITAGRVIATGPDGSYGTRTVVRTGDGTEIWYCHQSDIDVRVGDLVRPGERIGAVGSTGNVTGPHLHLEVRPAVDRPVDPVAWLVRHGLRP